MICFNLLSLRASGSAFSALTLLGGCEAGRRRPAC